MACQVRAASFRRRKIDDSYLFPLKRSKNASDPAKDEQRRPSIQQQRFPKPPLPPKRRQGDVTPLQKASQQRGNPSLEIAPNKGCDPSLEKGSVPSGHPLLNGGPKGQDCPMGLEIPSPHHEGMKGFEHMEESKPMDVDQKVGGRKIENFSFVNGEGEMDYPFQPRPSGFECKEEEEVVIPPSIFLHGVTSNGQVFKKMDIWKFTHAGGTIIWAKAKLHDWWELGEPSDSYKEFLFKSSCWKLFTDVAIGAHFSSKHTLRISIAEYEVNKDNILKCEFNKDQSFSSFISIGDRKNQLKVRISRHVILEDED